MSRGTAAPAAPAATSGRARWGSNWGSTQRPSRALQRTKRVRMTTSAASQRQGSAVRSGQLVDSVMGRLQGAGRRMTSQRRVIAEVFDTPRHRGEHVHLTADQVLASARASLPEVSLATVYNTLNDMVAIGALLEVLPDSGPKRYDPNVTHDHHHLVCTDCSRVFDVEVDDVPGLA